MGYLDPGIFGMISQIGYVLLFAVVSAFMFFFQPIKNVFDRVFKRGAASSAQVETDDTSTLQTPDR